MFEARTYDAAGRVGELTVPRAGVTVETPALLPVINPHLQTISPAELEQEFGAEILITNAYILYGSDEYREQALAEGLHDLYGFSGAIMTDSGSFQLAEYGNIDVDTAEILQFQADIGSDIATPVDVPTPPNAGRDQAERDLETTQAALETAADFDAGEMLINAPVQGGAYPDLRERAARDAYATGLDIYPVGAVVPLLNDYRYAEMVEAVAAAKRGLGADAPVHLFGAGHPMMFALAAALGCDLFDSAAYALYARDDRYLTVRGTEHLGDLHYFPCSCPVCTAHTPDDVAARDEPDREDLLARHNLHVTYAELRRVKQAIRRGNLLELVDERARSHPAMTDGYRTLLDHADWLEQSDPTNKDTFLQVSAESARRPEVHRHHERLTRLTVDADTVLVTEGGNNDRFVATWGLKPPFGPVPRALAKTYPLTAEIPERRSRAACEAAADGVARLATANPETEFTIGHFDWPASALARLPETVARIDLSEEEG
ncbi:tRNA guanosine(15) transglycosylase TgtA [Halosegnis sp.]|uniref:tRNA guanosine(15) transglycosylase TgtA n=1 Tax=Halosegnis sp. TaxID=2864959 RepID=UPI0035D46D99